MQPQPHTFRPADLVGGHVVLDLVNTVTGRDGAAIDWLDCYPRALEWAALTGQFDHGALAVLERLHAADPDDGMRALGRLRELREAVHDVLAATIRDEAPPERALARFEALWKEAVTRAHVTVSDRHMRLEHDVEASRLDHLAYELAVRAFELLQTFPLPRTRICAGTRCGWLFIDRSKGGRRRWCDMATCGNAAKSRRHYERKRARSNAQ
jgi:predicted RNA-binding Zn ribbon-like protein